MADKSFLKQHIISVVVLLCVCIAGAVIASFTHSWVEYQKDIHPVYDESDLSMMIIHRGQDIKRGCTIGATDSVSLPSKGGM